MEKRDLLIIACSSRKKQSTYAIPAIDLYDGPAYRTIRKRLNGASNKLAIWILSAKHGLIWADTPIFWYNERITKNKILLMKPKIETFIENNAMMDSYNHIFIWAGEEYLKALPSYLLTNDNVFIAKGPIGKKLQQIKNWCEIWNGNGHNTYMAEDEEILSDPPSLREAPHLAYLIPDWDDYLDPGYDFVNDTFSWSSGDRVRLYAHQLFKNESLYDGILISLGHIVMGKGLARNGLRGKPAIGSAREYLHLGSNHILMGDCGAFSYRKLPIPPFTTNQVIELYNSFQVDVGASIDHIPFGKVEGEDGELRLLNSSDVEQRIELTTKLAFEFISYAKGKAKFIPMGVIQARTPDEFALITKYYIKLGYKYIALGGLVPREDDEILKIVQATTSIIKRYSPSIRLHLFGVLREGLFPELKELGVASFDSGSYLRKAWLRSDKNYLSSSNKWYSAIRVPYSNDPRFNKNAADKGVSMKELQKLESDCLCLLREYGEKRRGLYDVLDKIVEYDSLLLRTSDTNNLREKYEITLKEAPWEKCDCPVCKDLGINIIVFRGFNRNKRRGFHNTRMFYRQLQDIRNIYDHSYTEEENKKYYVQSKS